MKLVVIGAQWGDEGKGKIVDFLAKDADLVIRFSGGANAGHTIVRNGTVYKLHLLPSGILYPGKVVILGVGMVIDIVALFEELSALESTGIQWKGRVLVSDRAHVVLPRYRELDREREKARVTAIGTTGRGIGVAYAQKADRDGIRVTDLFDVNVFARLPEQDRSYLEPLKERLGPMVADTSLYVAEHAADHVLFEGAQGALLDLDAGTYPFVSSGISVAAGAAIGGGVGPRALDRVIGVFKAYSTRVGNGPFPSEFVPERDGDLCDVVRRIGQEYGATTGRPRRCGYLDLVALKYACRVNSIDVLALTKLDVYDGFDEIKACISYDCNRERITEFPARLQTLQSAVPVTVAFAGWKSQTRSAKTYDDLPAQARDYICFIEDFVGVPTTLVSVGSERDETLVRKDPWKRS